MTIETNSIFPEPETISEPKSEPEIKRGRGRPVGSRNKSKEVIPESPALDLSPALISAVGSIFSIPFDIIASRTHDDKWRLSPEEKQEAGNLSSKVLIKYLPSILEKYIDELALALFILSIISIRMSVKSSPTEGETKKDIPDETKKNISSEIKL